MSSDKPLSPSQTYSLLMDRVHEFVESREGQPNEWAFEMLGLLEELSAFDRKYEPVGFKV